MRVAGVTVLPAFAIAIATQLGFALPVIDAWPSVVQVLVKKSVDRTAKSIRLFV
jgi:hypothetical protein